MARRYVLSMMAANRVGILAAVTNAMAELGGNLVEASQTVIQGFFTLIFVAEFPDDRDPQVIQDHVRDVCRPFDMVVMLKDPQQESFPINSEDSTDEWTLTVSGPDQPGILRDITSRLARQGIDIAGVHAYAMDDNSYLIQLRLKVPSGTDQARLHAELQSLGLSVELT